MCYRNSTAVQRCIVDVNIHSLLAFLVQNLYTKAPDDTLQQLKLSAASLDGLHFTDYFRDSLPSCLVSPSIRPLCLPALPPWASDHVTAELLPI